MKNTVSKLEKFAVAAVTAIIIGSLLFMSITIALVGLIALPFFLFFKKEKLRRKSEQPSSKSIDVEFKRVD